MIRRSALLLATVFAVATPVLEVEHLIDSLKAAGKKFEYKIYDDAPGGHDFNRIDTPLARESRREVLAFLARYVK